MNMILLAFTLGFVLGGLTTTAAIILWALAPERPKTTT